MFCKIFKKCRKIIAGCILGAGVRNVTDTNIASDSMVGFDCHWINHSWNQKNLGKIGGKRNDHCCKKGSKALERNSQVHFWN